MKLPWVTRIRLEYEQRHVKLLKTMLSEAHDDLKELRREFMGMIVDQQVKVNELVKTIVGMKRDGFEPPPPTIELVEEEKLPEAICEAINEASAKDSREYYTLMAYAREAVEAGESHENIIRKIIYGQEVDL